MVGGDGLRMSVPSPVEPVPPEMPIMQIGLRDWDMGKNYPAEMALSTDVRETLRALLPILQSRQSSEYSAEAKKRTAQLQNTNWTAKNRQLVEETRSRATEKPIHPDTLMMEIARNLPDHAVVVEEGISSVRNLLNFLPVTHRHRLFGLASGGIGCGIGAAVGIKLALPDRPVLAVIGDGSALYSIQALWTAANQRLPVTYVIINNGGYSILKERLMAYGGAAATSGKIIGMDLSDPTIAFVQLAAALGVPAMEITDPEKVGPAITESIHRNGPVLLDVKVRDISR
jgi:benzoylformate decarboxylase